MMHGQEKSDPVVVAKKPLNEAGQPGEEAAEPRTILDRRFGGNVGVRHTSTCVLSTRLAQTPPQPA